MKYIYLVLIATLSCFSVSAQDDINLEDYFSFYVTPDTASANTEGTWDVIIKAHQDIAPNTQFKIKFIKGFKLQSLFALLPGHVIASSSTEGGSAAITSVLSSYDANEPYWEMNTRDYVISLMVRGAGLKTGDSITVSIGKGNNLGKPQAVPERTAHKDLIEIAMSENGRQARMHLTSHVAEFEIRPLKSEKLMLFINSSAQVGQEVKLLITNADKYHNIDDRLVGEVRLSVNNPEFVQMPSSITLTPSDSGKKEIPVTFLKEGSYFVEAEFVGGGLLIEHANPIRVDNEKPQIFWGDLHSHGAPSRDGLGRDRYQFARYARGLDFMCATDHADHGKTIYGISDREWELQKREVVENHDPGKFITFLGYENSFLYPIGHYNIIFNVEDDKIDDIPMYAMRVVKDIQTIWNLAEQQGIDEMLTIPHHSGKVFTVSSEGNNCKNCNTFGGEYQNDKYKRLIEIFSYHGISEEYDPDHPLAYVNRSNIAGSFDGANYAQDAWAMGEVLGVIASSDNHFGQPGRTVNGIVGVLSPALERDSVFKNLQNRHTYGTTGERIWLDFRVNDELMGSVIQVDSNIQPSITLDVMGTDSIDYVEVLKWDFKRGVYEDGHPKFEVIKRLETDPQNPKVLKHTFIDEGMTDSCLYYLRVKQTNIILDVLDWKEVWAWSSPVWVSHATVGDTVAVESYQLKYNSQSGGYLVGDTLQIIEEGESGTSVEAIPDAGYHFAGWSDGVTDNPRIDLNIQSDISVTALFEKDISYYTVQYSAGENGQLSGDTLQTVEEGENGTSVEAIPNAGYHFAGWSDGVTDNPRIDLNIQSDISVTALFEKDISYYTVQYSSGANGYLVGDTLQTVEEGESGTSVEAIPDEGYHFAGWSDGVLDNPRTDSDVQSDISVTALFEISTGVSNSLLEKIKVYPNPTESVLNIDSRGVGVYEYVLSQVDGKVLEYRRIENEQHTIQLDKYSAGIYILSIQNDDNYHSLKIIKK